VLDVTCCKWQLHRHVSQRASSLSASFSSLPCFSVWFGLVCSRSHVCLKCSGSQRARGQCAALLTSNETKSRRTSTVLFDFHGLKGPHVENNYLSFKCSMRLFLTLYSCMDWLWEPSPFPKFGSHHVPPCTGVPSNLVVAVHTIGTCIAHNT
jgi:hypothetical protein